MKIKPEIYAKVLFDSLSTNELTKEEIAKKFWYSLQRNGQYKDLKNILEKLDQEYARSSKSILVKVYSAKILEKDELLLIEQKLEKKYREKIILENIIKKNSIAGIVVKIGDSEIDLSLEGKIDQLKQLLKG